MVTSEAIQKIILVDVNDQETGLMEKMEVHQKGLLHRAFSVFIFNSNGQILLQQRAAHKYHSAGLWSNTCCSHPQAGESSIDAAGRRLYEEMGMRCPLVHVHQFIYNARFDNGLTEHEYDHVFIGHSDELPLPDPEEVMDWRYLGLKELEQELKDTPQNYSVWLTICYDEVVERISNSPLFKNLKK